MQRWQTGRAPSGRPEQSPPLHRLPGALHDHAVQFYEHPDYLYEVVADFLATGLGLGEPAVVIATEEHRTGFRARLGSRGLDLERLVATGQLTLLDARETLDAFMVGSMPDWERFAACIGSVIEKITSGFFRAKHGLRAYGEMVDLLWKDGNPQAALRLEEYWNDLARLHSFSLLCAYTMGNFHRETHSADFEKICGAHTHAIPAESCRTASEDLASSDGSARLREFARLQQRALALENEIEQRKTLEVALREALAERKRSEERLAEDARLVETLHQIGTTLVAELDLQKLVQRVTDELTAITRARFGAFFYNCKDKAGESYVLYTLTGAPREKFEKFPLPRNTAIFAPTFNGTGVVRLDDVTKDPRYGKNAPREGMPEGHLPVRSYLAVPVVSRSGEVLGGLFFGHEATGVFTERAEKLAVGIAAQAAIAMDNARLYESVRSSEESLRDAVGARDELLAVVSHDLRNPLNVISMNTALLVRNAPKDEHGAKATRWALAANRAADRMGHLISDLLDVSRMEGTGVPVKAGLTDATSILNEAVESLHPIALEKNVTLAGTASRDPVVVKCDRERIGQVLSNLIGNALKFTTRGAVVVRLEPLASAVRFSVTDTGPGIAAADLERVWDRGWQASPASHQGSLGLGLYITKGIVEAHGGTVGVESEVGEGSTFWFTLPVG